MISAEEHPIAFGELVERHGAPTFRQRVRCREHDDELLPAEIHDASGPERRPWAYGDVARAGPDGVVKRPSVCELAERDRRARIAVVPELEGRWQDAEGDRCHRGHLEFAGLEPECAAGIARGAFGVRDGCSRFGDEGVAGSAEPDALGQTLQQRPAELLFEALDLLGQGRLGDEQPSGRPSEGAVVGDRHEVLQLAKVHGEFFIIIGVVYRLWCIRIFALWAARGHSWPMTSTNDIATSTRTTVRIPTASGDEIEAWLYRPEGDGPHPAVVMAHGIGGIKAGGLAPFAERFRCEGFVAVAFDYRHFGGSTGQPREQLSVPRELEDYRTVIGWAAAQPDIDARRIFAWGTSFAGMHIVELAASDSRLAGALAQAPLVDGLAAAAKTPPMLGLRLFSLAVLDSIGAILGRPPRYVPGHGAPGDFALGATEDGHFGERLMTPTDGTKWNDRVAARSLLSFSWRRPVRRAAAIRRPLLLVVAEDDTMAPVSPALRVADKAPQAELYRSRGGHYDVYEGGVDYDNVLRVEVEFLRRHAGLLAP